MTNYVIQISVYYYGADKKWAKIDILEQSGQSRQLRQRLASNHYKSDSRIEKYIEIQLAAIKEDKNVVAVERYEEVPEERIGFNTKMKRIY